MSAGLSLRGSGAVLLDRWDGRWLTGEYFLCHPIFFSQKTICESLDASFGLCFGCVV